jgi:hypothetical protein
LTGAPDDRAFILVEQRGETQLYRCSDEFVAAMADANRSLSEAAHEDDHAKDAELTRFEDELTRLDDAWKAHGAWHSEMVSTRNRLMRLGKARSGQEKGQPLFCWYAHPCPNT